MARIRISHVLTDMDQPGQRFSITYVKRDGTLGRVDTAVRGARNATVSPSPDGKRRHAHMKEKGLVKITNLDTGEVRDITIACIINYNGQRVHH